MSKLYIERRFASGQYIFNRIYDEHVKSKEGTPTLLLFSQRGHEEYQELGEAATALT